ncbi:hypothetical protein HanRHA438_Chr11g0530541 [Helianthus annuus]|nr:hypothetical protein HanIR_Chr11g0558881 [Helianthus annuus]KAJ0873044.1 hypothetical protein HanRHA438_Chr11g0530541 [Helianthus annuus]
MFLSVFLKFIEQNLKTQFSGLKYGLKLRNLTFSVDVFRLKQLEIIESIFLLLSFEVKTNSPFFPVSYLAGNVIGIVQFILGSYWLTLLEQGTVLVG